MYIQHLHIMEEDIISTVDTKYTKYMLIVHLQSLENLLCGLVLYFLLAFFVTHYAIFYQLCPLLLHIPA